MLPKLCFFLYLVLVFVICLCAVFVVSRDISEGGDIITQPGEYHLLHNISCGNYDPCLRVESSHVIIYGYGYSLSADSILEGLYVKDAQNVTIDSILFHTGIVFPLTFKRVSHSLIKSCEIIGGLRSNQGIALYDSNNISIETSTIHLFEYRPYDVYLLKAWNCTNISMRGNFLKDAIAAFVYGVQLYRSSNIVIHGNTFSNLHSRGGVAIALLLEDRGNNYQITNNVINDISASNSTRAQTYAAFMYFTDFSALSKISMMDNNRLDGYPVIFISSTSPPMRSMNYSIKPKTLPFLFGTSSITAALAIIYHATDSDFLHTDMLNITINAGGVSPYYRMNGMTGILIENSTLHFDTIIINSVLGGLKAVDGVDGLDAYGMVVYRSQLSVSRLMIKDVHASEGGDSIVEDQLVRGGIGAGVMLEDSIFSADSYSIQNITGGLGGMYNWTGSSRYFDSGSSFGFYSLGGCTLYLQGASSSPPSSVNMISGGGGGRHANDTPFLSVAAHTISGDQVEYLRDVRLVSHDDGAFVVLDLVLEPYSDAFAWGYYNISSGVCQRSVAYIVTISQSDFRYPLSVPRSIFLENSNNLTLCVGVLSSAAGPAMFRQSMVSNLNATLSSSSSSSSSPSLASSSTSLSSFLSLTSASATTTTSSASSSSTSYSSSSSSLLDSTSTSLSSSSSSSSSSLSSSSSSLTTSSSSPLSSGSISFILNSTTVTYVNISDSVSLGFPPYFLKDVSSTATFTLTYTILSDYSDTDKHALVTRVYEIKLIVILPNSDNIIEVIQLFQKDVSIVFRVSVSTIDRLDLEKICLAYWQNKQWNCEDHNPIIDRESGTITGVTPHLSIWSIVEEKPPAAPIPSPPPYKVIFGVVGALLVVVIIVLLIVLYRRRRSAKTAQEKSQNMMIQLNSSASSSSYSSSSSSSYPPPSSSYYTRLSPSPSTSSSLSSASSSSSSSSSSSYDGHPRDGGGDISPFSVSVHSEHEYQSTVLDSLEKYQIPSSSLSNFVHLGEGSSGSIFRCEWNGAPVAVKDVKLTASNQIDFIHETTLMRNLPPHPNVVTFFGFVTQPRVMIVMEYMDLGSLFSKLADPSFIITHDMQSRVLLQVALGMQHLHAQGIVHRDLAARNILMKSAWEAKVSDFGMSRLLYMHHHDHDRGGGDNSDGQVTGNPVGPVKWMAPESITSLKYSTKSDVYSFGTLMWEVFHRSVPFPSLTPAQVILEVTKGGRPSIDPALTPHPYRTLMMECWTHNPAERPSFQQIVQRLQLHQQQ
eukprot:TRINITY_DN5441_c0_g1_i2.p1 TRINITY_DN5441_c0_g1~~TRINITY_DN5441_c0_g1_i2.p1  ORF type:complete len:1266 (-),score=243.35 TRINITY_DN5441_c0_g1_i2:47-3844(-)